MVEVVEGGVGVVEMVESGVKVVIDSCDDG